ncbi:hypothetical protein M0R45_014592 [Rubus argutus]|uniref:Protein kinase domain-containing protein n=1 Tax=Rubus argutus TaxID=59490 RepID=A0AAW1XMM9_RUBAR
MGDIKHRNIVTLHGCYTAPHYNLLIHELLPNGSLDALLHGRRSMTNNILDWPSSYKIALGAARGISYLHLLIIDSTCKVKTQVEEHETREGVHISMEFVLPH